MFLFLLSTHQSPFPRSEEKEEIDGNLSHFMVISGNSYKPVSHVTFPGASKTTPIPHEHETKRFLLAHSQT